MNKNTKVKISDFLENEYKSYVFYVLENRALPSIVDGFKTGARKILHAAFNGSLKGNTQKKLLNLSGDTLNLSLYAHGDASLNGTIVTLAQDFKFNLNPLFIDGQYGKLRSPKAISAPRYLYVQQSKYANIYKTDYDLLDFIFEEGQYVEPKYYLPIIPVVLVNRQEGMAPGYKFSTMSYNPLDIIDSCIKCLTIKKDPLKNVILKPYIRGIDKKNWRFEDDKWVNYGVWEVNEKKNILTVKDLPYGTSFEDFEKLLNKYIDNEYIKDWKNQSNGDEIHYDIIFNKGDLTKELNGRSGVNKIINSFKLKQVVPQDLLWVLDENDKIKNFNSPKELIEYFVNFRLTIYKERKKRLVKILEERLKVNSDLCRFIELVCDGKLVITNHSKVDIGNDMKVFKLPMNLISTPMSKCTIEERNELLKENESIKKQLEYIKNTTEVQMYVNDLNDLKNELSKEFKQ